VRRSFLRPGREAFRVTPFQLSRWTAQLATTTALSHYYRSYIAVAVFGIAACVLVATLLGVGRALRPDVAKGEKYIAYESGSDPIGGWGQSNVRYYVYALLFVIFDVEGVFIFPWAVNLGSNSNGVGLGVFGLVEMLVFVAILALGLVYAWRKGVLRWA
jgi:NADH-quinone oxidoreductase subunit A